ncbi:MAG: cation-translocating P-type ATPase [Pirellulaceae bacterium]|nr:cation-translocating P-type ATPase [Pirellulaceae bacterium]
MTSPAPSPLVGAHHRDAAEVAALLKTDQDIGLGDEEAHIRRAALGDNALAEQPPNTIWTQLWGQCHEVVVWLLLAAAILAAFLGEWVDTAAILAIVVLNAALGVLQQRKAERALAALQKHSAPTAKVVRGGRLRTVAARELVPGDRIELEAGDHIPADARLLSGFGLQALEAPLTGESTPVAKEPAVVLPADTPLGDRRNMVFQGAVIATGKAAALVVSTGMQTELGRIAGLLSNQTSQPTPLQQRLKLLGQGLAIVCLVLVAFIFALQLARGGHWLETLHLAVSLAVAAIPEGLPAAVTITLAVGLERLVRRNAIIRKLASVETLGSVTVICSDKTGTLTKNEMTVREVFTMDGHFRVTGAGYGARGEFLPLDSESPVSSGDCPGLHRVVEVAAWCNHAAVVPLTDSSDGWQAIGDPTEAALVVLARKGGIESDSRGELLYEIPFDSDRKAMSILVRPAGLPPMLCTKGAPEVVLAKCEWFLGREGIMPLAASDRERIVELTRDMASRALRVLALAYRPDVDPHEGPDAERDLVFAGLVGMIDPPREEVRAAVADCRTAGIEPKMITGDHPSTALAIARELGIAGEQQAAITGQALDALDDAQLSERLASIAVFARVTAEHKLRIVRLLKGQGHIVAMTGDGVNDAPAVKSADIGIAMGITGTDVTKQASNLVLADDNFATIVKAVAEGRGIFDNIQKFIHYLLAGNAGKILFMFAAALLGWPNPLLALQLLWLNLVTDGLPALGLGVESPERGVMRRPPRNPQAPLLGWWNGLVIACHGALSAAAALLGFYLVYAGHPERLEEARVVAFCILAFAQLGFSLSCRSRTMTLWELGLGTNRPLLAAVAASLALQLAIVGIPWLHPVFGIEAYPAAWEWLLIAALSTVPLAAVEAMKIVCRFGWSMAGRDREPRRVSLAAVSEAQGALSRSM